MMLCKEVSWLKRVYAVRCRMAVIKMVNNEHEHMRISDTYVLNCSHKRLSCAVKIVQMFWGANYMYIEICF